MMDVLSQVVISNILRWEDQLLEKCVLPFFTNIEREQDRVVRVQSVQLVATFASKASGSHLSDLVEILEKLVKRFSEAPASSDTAVVFSKNDFDIQLEAVRGLIQCMKIKLSQGPGAVAKRCFLCLVSTLDNLYDRTTYLESTGDIRYEIFKMLLSVRANRDYHQGLPRSGGQDCGHYSFSPHVVCEKEDERSEATIVISLSRACMCVLRCLRDERDWSVHHVFPLLLQGDVD